MGSLWALANHRGQEALDASSKHLSQGQPRGRPAPSRQAALIESQAQNQGFELGLTKQLTDSELVSKLQVDCILDEAHDCFRRWHSQTESDRASAGSGETPRTTV